MRISKGTRVKLVSMQDDHSPSPGETGTVKFVDDMGTIHVDWDNGCGLGLIPGEDHFEIMED